MEQTILSIDLGSVVKSRIPETGKICLVSMESEETSDYPFIAEIEDQLLTGLCAQGLTILERDDDLLKRMIAEQSDDDYLWMRFPNDVLMAQQGISAGTASAGWGGSAYAGSYDRTTVFGAQADSIMTWNTQLAGSDYVLAYRVLECGIIYRDGTKRGFKTREGLLRLHVRLTNAESGQLMYAGNIQSTKSDQVPAEAVGQLSNFYYSFYPSNLPLERGPRSGYREIAGPSTQTQEHENNPK